MPDKVRPIRPRSGPARQGAAVGTAMKIAVIGVGYVGLVTAACLAKFGHRVMAVDVDADKVDALQHGRPTIHEVGLGELLRAQLAAGRLGFGCDVAAAMAEAEIVFIAVGTPARSDGSAALEAFDAVIAQLQALPRAPATIVLKSTLPVGTARRVQAALAAGGSEVLSNPEFLREGSAVQDFLAPDRIIIGSDDPAGAASACLLRAYRPLVEQGVPVLTMDTRSAELSKCAANAMLAARISFVNEIAAIAAATGADIERVCDGIGSDRRIGRQFLQAGVGYGGSCFPKDVAALRHTAREHRLRAELLDATERVNRRQHRWPLAALRRDFGNGEALRGLHAAVWGLSFKPGTDDMRDAPSVPLIERLCRAGVELTLYDPAAMDNARQCLPVSAKLHWADSAAVALEQADVLLLLTEWPEFVSFAPERAAAKLRLRIVYDGRNALDRVTWRAAGLRLVQIGRPDHAADDAAQARQPALPASRAAAL